jgi:hypothetical protein
MTTVLSSNAVRMSIGRCAAMRWHVQMLAARQELTLETPEKGQPTRLCCCTSVENRKMCC